MSNLIKSTTELAMYFVEAYAKPGSVLVDATAGQGHDTLALARMNPAAVFSFDIQPEAIEATYARLKSEGFNCRLHPSPEQTTPPSPETPDIALILDSHQNINNYIDNADVIVFNLGYLPGGDKRITTNRESTLQAVATALEILNKDGLLCITMYSGHSAGAAEKEMLLDFARKLNLHKYHTAYVNMLNQTRNPPEILLITKKK